MAWNRAKLRAALSCQAGRIGRLRARLARRRFPDSADDWLSSFREDAAPSTRAYADLMRYFVAGFVAHRSRLGAHADYPGLGSYNGPAMDRLEGFSRLAPLLAAWLHGGRAARMALDDGVEVDLVALLRDGILAGTDPDSREYWGRIGHWSQAVVEAADIALALWLTRPLLWDGLDDAQRRRIADWLIQVNGKRIPDNNWHLFVVQVNAALAALGERHDDASMREHYQRARTFHRGGGWFRDGERDDTPGFDYYNAWGFHYHLQWIARIRPAHDAEFIAGALADFVGVYRYFIGPHGFPVMGRSACYRMAAPVPLIFAQDRNPPLLAPGEARRALDATWRYFIRRGAVAHGNVTQGYHGDDARLLENYSGPASCLWSLRSLVAAFALPDTHDFWRAPPAPLPVETGDFTLEVAVPGWRIEGERASGNLTLFTGAGDDPPMQNQRMIDRLIEKFACKPRRPANIPAKYRRSRYDASRPFGLRDASGATLSEPTG